VWPDEPDPGFKIHLVMMAVGHNGPAKVIFRAQSVRSTTKKIIPCGAREPLTGYALALQLILASHGRGLMYNPSHFVPLTDLTSNISFEALFHFEDGVRDCADAAIDENTRRTKARKIREPCFSIASLSLRI
jgi:hypothetical protein